ncbi:MAG: hypothetical protein AAFO75_13030, partial [Pseudomonadota bacterium]
RTAVILTTSFSSIGTPFQAYQAAFPKLKSWNEVEIAAKMMNMTMPIELNEVVKMTAVRTEKDTRTVIYDLAVETDTINETNFDPADVKQAELESSCDDENVFLGDQAETIRMVYSAKDGTTGEIAFTRSDCDALLSPVAEPTEVAEASTTP